jgi:hypothetical protein
MKVKCACGANYQIHEKHAGKKFKCKKCDSAFTIPQSRSERSGSRQAGGGQSGQSRYRNPAGTQSNDSGRQAGGAKAGRQLDDLYDPTSGPRRAPMSQAEIVAAKKRQKEDALLSKFMDPDKKSLEEKMHEMRDDRIEKLRIPNAFRYIFISLILFAVGIVYHWLISSINTEGGFLPIYLGLLCYSGSRWWFPAILFLIGIYDMLVGVGALFRVVDIDDEEALPGAW